MTTGGGEPGVVEPPAHLPRCVAVQLEELDAVVAQPADASDRSLEIAVAFLPDRVELERDSRHGSTLRVRS